MCTELAMTFVTLCFSDTGLTQLLKSGGSCVSLAGRAVTWSGPAGHIQGHVVVTGFAQREGKGLSVLCLIFRCTGDTAGNGGNEEVIKEREPQG